jgi:SRSO17 transposase
MQTTTGSESAASSEEQELRIISQGWQALAELSGRIGAHVRRAEVRTRLQRYLQGLLASVERKNGWQLSGALGEPNAHGVQRLLAEADWDEEAVRDELRAYVLEHLGAEQAVLVVDEPGFLKKGKKSAGVARQYSGTAGRRENCQIGVLLLYASPKGHAFLDRARYLPEEWTQDPVRCRAAGIPEEVTFATKGELAQSMLARAFAAGVQAQWVVGDTVYGYDELRLWLEEQQPYVVAVPETHAVWVAGQQQPVGFLAALLPQDAWAVLSAGEGSKGARLYEWAWLRLPEQTQDPRERARWVLVRRSLADPSKCAYYRAAGPAQTSLEDLVRVAGSRWRIEEGIEAAKGEVGLDHYEVRTWRAWYRYVTLALVADAALVMLQGQAREAGKKAAPKRRESR